MSNGITELLVEQCSFDWLRKLGYEMLSGLVPGIPRICGFRFKTSTLTYAPTVSAMTLKTTPPVYIENTIGNEPLIMLNTGPATEVKRVKQDQPRPILIYVTAS